MTHSPGVPPAAAPPQRRLLPSCFLAASPRPAGRLCSRPRPCAALLPPFLSLCEHPLACGVGSGPRCCMGTGGGHPQAYWVQVVGDWLGVARAGHWRSGDSGI